MIPQSHAAPAAPAMNAQPSARPASALSRWASLAYGLFAYLLFFVTFVYLIGFVTGLAVPITVDGGAPGSLATAFLVNGGFLALFAVQHTIMARPAFKRRWTQIVPAQVERSTFVLLATAILIGMVLAWRAIPGVYWQVEGPLALVLHGIALSGFGIVLFSSFLIDHFELFGLRQVVRHFRGAPPAGPHFRERSLYRFVRHPLMFGFLLAFWSTPVMTGGHLFFAALCTLYILVGVRIEEHTLVAEHGERYRSYQRRVPMLLPLRRPSA
jgi:protein-S-isoprenylcysteine O-methyltransferase Ste14